MLGRTKTWCVRVTMNSTMNKDPGYFEVDDL